MFNFVSPYLTKQLCTYLSTIYKGLKDILKYCYWYHKLYEIQESSFTEFATKYVQQVCDTHLSGFSSNIIHAFCKQCMEAQEKKPPMSKTSPYVKFVKL